jgi:pilus assembly protein CpaB
MKSKSIIPIIIALVIALAGSLYLYTRLNKVQRHKKQPKDIAVNMDKMVNVAMAAQDLTGTSELNQEMIEPSPFEKKDLSKEYITDFESLEGRVTIAPIKKGEPILKSKLAPEGGIAAMLEKGTRAIAVEGNKIMGLSGFIRPKDRVDVLVTVSKKPKSREKISKIVLENILVLATGTQLKENEKGEPSPVEAYTLQVTPEEGEKLAIAANQGKLLFALRNTADAEEVLTYGATVPQALSSYQGAPKVKSSKRGSSRMRKRTFTMEVIKDGKVIKKKFQM